MLWHTSAIPQRQLPCGKAGMPFGLSYRVDEQLNPGRWCT
jgi:hypothetical protein